MIDEHEKDIFCFISVLLCLLRTGKEGSSVVVGVGEC